MKPRP